MASLEKAELYKTSDGWEGEPSTASCHREGDGELQCSTGTTTVEIDGLKKRSAEARGDLYILLRAVRHASPHPDEPGGHRRRLHDSWPEDEEPDGEHDYPSDSPQPEGEYIERAFRADASRSRDGEREGPESESFEEEYEWRDDPTSDDVLHDPEEYEYWVQAAHRRARRDLHTHHLVIQGNNLGVQIHTMANGSIQMEGFQPRWSTNYITKKHLTYQWLDTIEMKTWCKTSKGEITTCCTRARRLCSSRPWKDYMASAVPESQLEKMIVWPKKRDASESRISCSTTRGCEHWCYNGHQRHDEQTQLLQLWAQPISHTCGNPHITYLYRCTFAPAQTKSATSEKNINK